MLCTGWGVSKRDGVLGNGMACYFPGWGVVKGIWCYLTGWGVSVRVGVLVNGMGCNFPGWGVTFRDGVLV